LKPTAPICPKIPKTLSEHGTHREDPYFWLREKENPEVKKYVEAENAYYTEKLKPIADQVETSFEQLKALLEKEAIEVPYRSGSYWYGSRTPENSEYPILFRTKALTSRADETVLLDLNQVAKAGGYLSLHGFSVSHDENFLAYSLDTDGSERDTIYLKDLRRDLVLPQKIGEKRTHGEAVWSNDGAYLFYTEQNDQDRPDTVIRHEIASGKEEKIYVEKDPRFFVGVSLSKDERYILIESAGKESSETFFIPAGQPTKSPQVILPRRENHLYTVQPQGNRFLILTNSGERNYRLMTTPLTDFSEAAWTEILRGDHQIDLRELEVYDKGFAILYGDLGTLKMGVYESSQTQAEARDHKLRDLEFPEAVYSVSFLNNDDYQNDQIRVFYSSPKTPPQTIEYDFDSGKKTILHQRKIEGFNSELYDTQKILVPSHDGVMVPVSILYRKDKGVLPRPTILKGYGSYGYPYPDNFSAANTHLADLGFVFASAHIRGGGCLGQRWYDDGKFLKKKNTFLDFVAAGIGLIKEGFTQKGELSIVGGSAGGMLVTAAMNLDPGLFKSVAAIVPFVDVINTMWDETLPLTPIEFDEWGNPKDKKFYDYMLSYSPYDNLKNIAYPHLYMTCGWNDPRVTYWEPAKFAAKMRELRQGAGMTLLWTNMDAGHAGKSGRFEYLRETAQMNAFFYALHFDPNRFGC
jgi:oligopeptidase B